MKARAILAGTLLFPPCLLLHELGHLALVHLLGGSGVLVVRPWRFQFLPLALPSWHVTGGAALAPLPRLLFDAGGPLLAMIPLGALLLWGRSPALRAAAVANAVSLLYFALIESADYLLESRGAGLDFLGWEELNYGLPALAVVLASLAARGTVPLGSREAIPS